MRYVDDFNFRVLAKPNVSHEKLFKTLRTTFFILAGMMGTAYVLGVVTKLFVTYFL